MWTVPRSGPLPPKSALSPHQDTSIEIHVQCGADFIFGKPRLFPMDREGPASDGASEQSAGCKYVAKRFQDMEKQYLQFL
jgi:hypothetical protein